MHGMSYSLLLEAWLPIPGNRTPFPSGHGKSHARRIILDYKGRGEWLKYTCVVLTPEHDIDCVAFSAPGLCALSNKI